MPAIVVLGGGVCGLATALMLARDGHDVTLLERDRAPVPESTSAAWDRWERGGVAQFRQPHYMQARGHQVLATELPDVCHAFADAGALRMDPIRRRWPASAARPVDSRLETLTGRRPALELALARAAERQPRLNVRRGAAAAALTTHGMNGAARVTGVRTAGGESLSADLVVDAMGRGSRMPRLLAAAGIEPAPEETAAGGFIYYSRFFHGAMPEARASQLTPVGSFSIVTLPADAGTWSVTIYVAAGDRPLKRLRHEEAWTALVRACPRHALWLDGEPLTGVIAMGGIVDRRRSAAPAVGVASVADAWACTNPSLGRGMALGLAHVALLRDVARDRLGDPGAFSAAWQEATERELAPWHRATVAADRARLADIDAIRAGRAPAPPGDEAGALRTALPAAMAQDPDVFRAGMEIINCLALPQDVFSRPGLAARVLALAGGTDGAPRPGPGREELLRLVA